MSIWKYTNVIIARKLDAEQEKPSLPSCAQCCPPGSLTPLTSVLTVWDGGVNHTCGHRLSCGLGLA